MNNHRTGEVSASFVLASYPRVRVPIIVHNLAQHLVAGSVHAVIGRNVVNR